MRPHRIALAVLAVVAIATDPPSAHASTTADQFMGAIAAHTAQGWIDNALPPETLEHRIRTGGRVYITCSIVADLGVRAARRHGIPARHVSVLTNGRFDGYNDGHSLVELKLGGHWVLYDLAMDRVAVDPNGRRIGLAAQVAAGHDRRWRKIAHDSTRWNFTGLPAATRRAVQRVYATPVADWYDHVMGVALVETSPGQYAYHAARPSPRVQAVWPGHYVWVNAATWRALNA